MTFAAIVSPFFLPFMIWTWILLRECLKCMPPLLNFLFICSFAELLTALHHANVCCVQLMWPCCLRFSVWLFIGCLFFWRSGDQQLSLHFTILLKVADLVRVLN